MNFEERERLQQDELKRQARLNPGSSGRRAKLHRRHCGKLADDEIDQIVSDRNQLIARIQDSYGLSKADADRQLRNWESRQSD